jgi:oxygen-independent coproporphyrinogen-3 oxidase
MEVEVRIMLTSMYIHIPFCDHICTYCDFHKSLASDAKKGRYIDALCRELHHRSEELTNVRTIFIGGGTPLSLNEPMLEALLQTIAEVVDLDQVLEYSIETNPNNLSESKIALLQRYGVNRVSIGVQTFDKQQLHTLGRDHKVADVKKGIRRLRKANFPNISVDLIFSLVGQTLADLDRDIDLALKLDVDHISYYSLILEERTILYHQYLHGDVAMNEEDIEAAMFDRVIERLTTAGYEHYEISNFAKPGKRSLHNMAYWHNDDYLGFGSGAHSHVNGKRFYHVAKVAAYINQIEQDSYDYYHIEDVDDCVDDLLVGLRMIEGVDLARYESRCHISVFDLFPEVERHLADGLLEIVDGHLRLTPRGIRLGNLVFMTFLEGS